MGDGAPGWGQLSGIIFNGTTNPTLCPEHLKRIADFMDEIKTFYEMASKR